MIDMTWPEVRAAAERKAIVLLPISIVEELGIDIYNIASLTTPKVEPLRFAPRRIGAYLPDYHAGAVETSQMNRLNPRRVRAEIAKGLEPEPRFDPLGYVGDPASHMLEPDAVDDIVKTAEYSAAFIESILSTR